MKIDNIRFSHYRFSENEVLYENPSTAFPCSNEMQNTSHYTVVTDGISVEESKSVILRFKSLIDYLSKNPNYKHYLEDSRVVYCKCDIIKDFNPIIIINEKGWHFLHGLLLGACITDEIDTF